jgi:ABC-type thiamin/hydroxymethylpyrimidine transport system permease subunit
MPEINAKETAIVTGTIIIVLGVLIGLQTLVQGVPIEDVPVSFRDVFAVVKTFFSSAPVLALIGFGRNIYGYLVEYFKSECSEEYDWSKLAKTLTLYIGAISTLITVAQTLPEPYGEIISTIGSAVIIILDLTKKQIADIVKSTSAC